MGFCLPSLPCANSPSRPHCLGNALQSPHKGKLHRGGWSCLTPGEGFHGNDDITRLVWLQSQALNGGAWVFTLQSSGERQSGTLQCWSRRAGPGFQTQACPWLTRRARQSPHLQRGGLKPCILCRRAAWGRGGGREWGKLVGEGHCDVFLGWQL